MPVFRSGVHPREPMVQLHAKECVCNTEVMIGAKLQKALTIFIAFANTKVTKAIRPGALIVAHSSVEIAEENQHFVVWDMFDSIIQLAVKGILGIGTRSQGWSVDRKQVGGT